MLGSASNFDHVSVTMLQNGKWIWKDDTNTLEFVCNTGPYTDRADKKKRKAHVDHNPKRNDKISSSAGNRSFGASRANIRMVVKSPRPTGKAASHMTFTLDDIKNITLEMFSEVNPMTESFFELFHTEQFNAFLLHLLNYFHYYFLKLNIDAQPKDMYIEQGVSEIETYSDMCTRVTVAQKLLGQSYSVLVMGLGLDDMHHMTCGHSRVSSTQKDRIMYETFYSYLCLFVWINFKRKDRPTVRKEIGRMLRSDTFNPAIRIKNAPNVMPCDSDDKAVVVKEQVKLTPAQYRRLHGKRPAIQSIINQRSPVIVSIVPSPKEEASDLFVRKSMQNKNNIRQDIAYEDLIEMELKQELKNLKVGILGDHISLYNPQNLMALSEDKEENDNDNDNENANATQPEKVHDTVVTSDVPSTKASSPDKVSRQLTEISQATTEALTDEE